MKLTWHLVVIIIAVILGFCFWHKGAEKDDMTEKQKKDGEMNRRVAGALWGIAIGVFAIWLYKLNNKQLGNMCGGGVRAFMNGNTNHVLTNHVPTNHVSLQPHRTANMSSYRPSKVYRHNVVDLNDYIEN